MRTDEAIDIYWQVRFEKDGGVVRQLDENGDVEKTMKLHDVEWGECWRHAGTILFTDEMVEMSGYPDFERFCFGLMRHAVRLISCGYGETIDEVIGWFNDFEGLDFVVEEPYRIVGSHGELHDLEGDRVVVARDDEDMFSASIDVRGEKFNFDLNQKSVFTSFIIATSPQ